MEYEHCIKFADKALRNAHEAEVRAVGNRFWVRFCIRWHFFDCEYVKNKVPNKSKEYVTKCNPQKIPLEKKHDQHTPIRNDCANGVVEKVSLIIFFAVKIGNPSVQSERGRDKYGYE